MSRIRSIAKWSVGSLVVAVLAAQLVPVDRTNPVGETEVPASAEARAVLRRACYDCHSNETVWPWYSRVAPVSWLVAYDVRRGREEFNFSAWNRLAPERRIKVAQTSLEEIRDDEMPPGIYVSMHSQARISKEDLLVLRQWADAASRLD